MIPTANLIALHHPINAIKRKKHSGASDPWIAEAMLGGRRRRLVVKFCTGEMLLNHMVSDMLVSEYVCAVLFERLGVPVAPACRVMIPPLLMEQIEQRHPELHGRISDVEGPHFATEFQENMADVQGDSRLDAESHMRDAEDILAADMLVLNTDRRSTGKSNLLYDARRLLAIDHGLAFAALRAGESWPCLPPYEVGRHMCSRLLGKSGGRSPDFADVFGAWVREISGEVLSELRAGVPESWDYTQEHFDAIFEHLQKHDSRLDLIARKLGACFPGKTISD